MVDLFNRAKEVIPGGVNSPVRAFTGVGGDPIFVESAKGSKIITVEGKELLDFNGSWGPLILGHSNEIVIEAIKKAAEKGTTFGINSPGEVELAEKITTMVSSIDKVRLVNSGTEAVMTAIRLARGYTERTKIIKFEGCYHGHSDSLLVSAGSGLLTQGKLSSKGVPKSVIDDIIILPYNDEEAVIKAMTEYEGKIAAIITEPIAGNMGLISPLPNFLNTLQSLCRSYGSLLIFDEVITGFRFHAGTFGDLISIKPDITTLGKIIGGGMPIGAIGGRKDIMDQLAPLGDVYQAGTLSGNPVAVAAGIATLNELKNNSPYEKIEELGKKLERAFNKIPNNPLLQRQAGAFTPFFSNKKSIENYDEAKRCNTEMYGKFFHSLLSNGIYLSPSQFEVSFISAAHTEEDIEFFLKVSQKALAELN